MGILDKIFAGKETKTEKIRFSQLDSWIKNKLETKNSKTYSECKEILGAIVDSVKDIHALVNRLERVGFQHNVPVKIYKIVKASKPKYVVRMLDILGKIEGKYPKSYADLEEFQNILGESMTDISKISVSHGRYLPLAFEDRFTEIHRETKRLFELSNKLALSMKSDDITANYKNLLSETDEIKNLREQLDSLVGGEKFAENDIKSILTEIEKLKYESSNLAKSEEYICFAELEEQHKNIIKSKDNIESTIYNNLNPLIRLMRKFRYIQGEKPELENICPRIDRYIDKPVEQFISDNSNDINIILNQIKQSVERNELDVKDMEKKKIVEKIDNAIVNLSDDIRQKYLVLCKKEDEIKSKIAVMDIKNKIETIGNNINELDRKLSLEHNDLNKTRNKRNTIDDEIKSRMANLPDMISKIEGIEILIS